MNFTVFTANNILDNSINLLNHREALIPLLGSGITCAAEKQKFWNPERISYVFNKLNNKNLKGVLDPLPLKRAQVRSFSSRVFAATNLAL